MDCYPIYIVIGQNFLPSFGASRDIVESIDGGWPVVARKGARFWKRPLQRPEQPKRAG